MTDTDISTNGINGEDFENLKSLSDCKIRTEDGYVYNVHRFMLARKSKYFFAIFFGMNKDRRDILIPGVKGHILGKIIRYICSNDILLTSENLNAILVASDYLLVNDLFLKVKDYAKEHLSVGNCCELFCTSLNMGNLQDLLQECFRYIQTHFEDIVTENSANMELFPVDILKELICDENVCVRNYATIWKSIVRWVESEIVLRQVHVLDLLSCLSIECVDEGLAFSILNHYLVIDNPYCNGINELKCSADSKSCLQLFTRFLQNNRKVDSGLRKQSFSLYFISKKHATDWIIGGKDLFVTYDKNVDLWRKITEMPFVPDFLLTIGSRFYAITETDTERESKLIFYTFDLIDKHWVELEAPSIRYSFFFAIVHEELIYLLFTIYQSENNEVQNVHAFNPFSKTWISLKPLVDTIRPHAASLGKNLYVTGYIPRRNLDANENEENQNAEQENRNENHHLTAQTYDPERDAWTLLPPPAIIRHIFEFTAFHHRVYLFGKVGSYQEYTTILAMALDPDSPDWENLPNLPFIYSQPRAIILDDRLIIYDSYPTDPAYLFYLKTEFPPVFWNEELKSWETVTNLTISNHLHQYNFYPITQENIVKIVKKENKDMNNHFVKSPFS